MSNNIQPSIMLADEATVLIKVIIKFNQLIVVQNYSSCIKLIE